MILDSGFVAICALVNVRKNGEMPKDLLVKKSVCPFGERTIGMSRYYSAKSANQSIDSVIRIHCDRTIRSGMYAIIGFEQFRIDLVQHIEDDGEKMTDLTLVRLEDRYDVLTNKNKISE